MLISSNHLNANSSYFGMSVLMTEDFSIFHPYWNISSWYRLQKGCIILLTTHEICLLFISTHN